MRKHSTHKTARRNGTLKRLNCRQIGIELGGLAPRTVRGYIKDGLLPRHKNSSGEFYITSLELKAARHDELLGLGAAARLIGVHPDTLKRWDYEGRVDCARSEGGKRRFTLAHVSELIQLRHGKTTSPPQKLNYVRRTMLTACSIMDRSKVFTLQKSVIESDYWVNPWSFYWMLTYEPLPRWGDLAIALIELANKGKPRK